MRCSQLAQAAGLSLLALLAATAAAQSITIDNSDPDFHVLIEVWSTGTSAPGHWGADYRYRTTTGYGSAYGEVEWRPNLPSAGLWQVSIYYPQGTNRAPDAPFTVQHAGGSTTYLVDQQHNGGQWNVLGTFQFNAGTSGRVWLSNNASPSVVIADAVRFTPVSGAALTMTVSPADGGSTTPPVGGPYLYAQNEIVPITAVPAPGREFYRWYVSAGSDVADPNSPSTTVLMDQDKTVAALFIGEQPEPPEFRAFWADAFHAGFKSVAEIDQMIGLALAGNYNAIMAEVLAFQDTGGGGHGAYWTSDILPEAADVVGGIDPLAELVQRCHAAGLELHCWLVAFRVSSVWPPSGNPTVAAHPEWLMVRQQDMNQGPLPVNDGNPNTTDYYVLDPGSPDVQDYLQSIVRELCENYELDGIHWDYIRYTQTNCGYSTTLSYPDSSLRRFQEIHDYAGTPAYSGVPLWNDFRRRTITEVVRRTMSTVATIPNPRQPLRHTAALVTWYPANSDFHQTNPYQLFCDWEYWQSMGYLDATIPMCYFREDTHADTYRAWVDNSVAWAAAAGRQTYIGLGIYLNTFEQTSAQLEYARNAGAAGITTYSYASTNDGGIPWDDWYDYVAAHHFTEPAEVPAMPWRDSGQATQGAIFGRVTDGATGTPIDNATLSVNGAPQVQTDGNGCFLLSKLPAAAGGTLLSVSASAEGYAQSAVRPHVQVVRAGYTEANFALGTWRPGDYDVDGDVDAHDWVMFQPALTGPALGPPPPGGDVFDLNADLDVDLADFAGMQ